MLTVLRILGPRRSSSRRFPLASSATGATKFPPPPSRARSPRPSLPSPVVHSAVLPISMRGQRRPRTWTPRRVIDSCRFVLVSPLTHALFQALQVVEILSDSDSETDTPVKSTQVKLLPKKYNPELAVKVKVERGGEPPLPRFDLSAVVASGRRGVQTTPVHAPPGPAPATITAGNSGGTGIPGYAQSRWVTDFLPTMHAALGTMENMWELPGGDVKFIQMIWDRVHPGSGYVVALGCPVYTKVSLC